MRQLIDAGNDIAASAFNPEGRSGTAELVDEAEQSVSRLPRRARAARKGFHVPCANSAQDLLDTLDERTSAGADAITGLSHRLRQASTRMTQGLQKGDLIILAGRPSMGKTTLALNIAEFAAFNAPRARHRLRLQYGNGRRTARAAIRFIAGKVPQGHLRNGEFADADWPKITGALEMNGSQAPIVYRRHAAAESQRPAFARTAPQAQHGIGLIVVDYLQLMQVPGRPKIAPPRFQRFRAGLKAWRANSRCPSSRCPSSIAASNNGPTNGL